MTVGAERSAVVGGVPDGRGRRRNADRIEIKAISFGEDGADPGIFEKARRMANESKRVDV